MLILGLTATAVVGSTLSAQAVVIPDPGSVGSDLATCSSPDTSVAGRTSYTDTSAPAVKSLQWRVKTPAVKVAPILDAPAAGVVAAIRGRVVQKCSGVDSLASVPAARALVTFAAPGALTPYPLTATDSTVSTNVAPFDQTVFGADRRWCPADAGHTSVASVTTRQRFSAFTLIDGSPATLDPLTTTDGADAAKPLAAPATAPLLRTKTRIVLTFSKAELPHGRPLTVNGQLQRLTTKPRAHPTQLSSPCGAAAWLPLAGNRVVLTVAIPAWANKPHVRKVVLTKALVTDSAGRVHFTLPAVKFRDYTFTVAGKALPAWLAGSVSETKLVFVD